MSVRCERDVRYTQTKIIKLLEDGVFDPSRAADLQLVRTVKPDLSSRSKIDKTKIFMTNGSLMKVESVAECSHRSILQYFWPGLSDNWSKNQTLNLFFEWPFKTGFTVPYCDLSQLTTTPPPPPPPFCTERVSPRKQNFWMTSSCLLQPSHSWIFHLFANCIAQTLRESGQRGRVGGGLDTTAFLMHSQQDLLVYKSLHCHMGFDARKPDFVVYIRAVWSVTFLKVLWLQLLHAKFWYSSYYL